MLRLPQSPRLGLRKSNAMARIKTALTAKSGAGDANPLEWRRLIDELNLRRRAAAEGGSTKARERHVARGKLLARERVAALVDPGSPFLEIGALAAFDMYEGDVHGAGLVAGIGLIEGREVMIVANDPTIKGGGEPPPLCLSGRLGRRQLAVPG